MPQQSSARAVNPLEAHEFAIKFYAVDAAGLGPRDFIPIFHEWIKSHRLEDEVMIDVADYSHVHHGPGVFLMCHEGQYSLDQAGGRLGLLYTRKRRTEGDVRSRLRRAFGTTLKACKLLQAEPALEGKLHFRYDEALFKIQNRLLAPRTPEAFDAVKDGMQPFLDDLYPEADDIRVEATGEPNEPLAMRIVISSAPDVGELISRLVLEDES
jgi:hypothetical protein